MEELLCTDEEEMQKLRQIFRSIFTTDNKVVGNKFSIRKRKTNDSEGKELKTRENNG